MIIEKQELLILMMGKLRDLQADQVVAEADFIHSQPNPPCMWFFGQRRKMKRINGDDTAKKILASITDYYQHAIKQVRINTNSVKASIKPQHNISPEYATWMFTRDELFRGTNEIIGSSENPESDGCTDTSAV